MAPVRTEKQPRASSSNNPGAKLKLKYRHPQKPTIEGENTVPGIQKIKSAIRQTKRLLAKDKLAANVRVETERRLKGLEKDMAEAERIKKERTLAHRYHKVKFFERRKVARKIDQVKRQLEASTDRKEIKKREKELFALRVDLNYIMHYPKLKKYISLFPPDVRQNGHDNTKGDNSDEEDKTEDQKLTDQQREETRQLIRERMEKGELSMEPELEDHDARANRQKTAQKADRNSRENVGENSEKPGVVQEDDFFGNDSEENMDDS